MSRRRAGGFVFVTYKGDHPPLHVHIEKEGREIGRWDIENQKPMDNLEVSQKLISALKQAGYLIGGRLRWQ
jgi:hypothetical protein